MAIQLPQEELGTSIGVLVYSLLCLACSVLMAWLVYAHHEGLSYVALVSYFTGLSTAASVAQQTHTLVRWRDIKLEQFQHSNANVGNPELAIAGQSTGLDLALFYIQFYSYNVEAALTFFWAVALTQSIFQLEPVKSLRKRINYIAKATAVLLPALLIGILRLKSVQKHTVPFLILADGIMGFCLSGSGVLLIVILVKYIHTRRNLLSWNVQYGQRSNSTKSSDTLVFDSNNGKRRQTIYDRWLVVRFSIAFVALAIFQFVTIMFQVSSARQNSRDSLSNSPDLSTERLHLDLLLFIPGVSASLLTFVVFGTTKTFRDYLADKLIPQKLRDRNRRETSNPSPRRTRLSQAFSQRSTAYPPRLSLTPYVSNDGGLYTPTFNGDGIQLRELDANGSRKAAEDDQWPLVSTNAGSNVPKKPVNVYLFPKQ
ncbi:glycoside hydrolase [Colletotrichum tofieldiae]|uniref:Glycoside hydrolase n=1 Tax=Colletotrichum tofieldiae TaxID=708197 RepID=A0A166S483_9PEZI|nr:glycoside hydrolase [Colletotrichum tofieldiae]